MTIVWIVIGIAFLVILASIFAFGGENERIKTLFRIYRRNKLEYPELTEQEQLETVIEELITPGRAIRLKGTSLTGKKYIQEVFGSTPLTVDDVIDHIIGLEFNKYRYELTETLTSIQRIQRIQTGKLSERDKLKLKIGRYHKMYLSDLEK